MLTIYYGEVQVLVLLIEDQICGFWFVRIAVYLGPGDVKQYI